MNMLLSYDYFSGDYKSTEAERPSQAAPGHRWGLGVQEV